MMCRNDPMNKKKLLITGVSGLLGSNLAYYFKDQYEVLGIFNQHPFHPSWCRTEQADLSRPEACQRLVCSFHPDLCIHCAALADIDRCENEKSLAYKANVEVTRLLTCALEGMPCKFVFISTDAVYGAGGGHAVEDDPVQPLNYYAETKLCAERDVGCYPDALIARTSFFGWGFGDSRLSIAEWALKELSAGRKVYGFTDVITSSIYIFALAELLEKAFARNLTGIFNFASSDSVSKDSLIRTIARLFALDTALIDAVSIDQFPLRVPRSKDLGLSVRKLSQALGVVLPTVEEGLERFYQDQGKCKALAR